MNIKFFGLVLIMSGMSLKLSGMNQEVAYIVSTIRALPPQDQQIALDTLPAYTGLKTQVRQALGL